MVRRTAAGRISSAWVGCPYILGRERGAHHNNEESFSRHLVWTFAPPPGQSRVVTTALTLIAFDMLRFQLLHICQRISDKPWLYTDREVGSNVCDRHILMGTTRDLSSLPPLGIPGHSTGYCQLGVKWIMWGGGYFGPK